jgi:hypothetical protein
MRKFALLCLLAVNMALVAGDAGYTFPKSTSVATTVTEFSNADKVVAKTDQRVMQTGTMSNYRTVTLPAASDCKAGYAITVGDSSGTVSQTNYIRVIPAGTDTINGAATADTLTVPYGTRQYVSNGVDGWNFDATTVASSIPLLKSLTHPVRILGLSDSILSGMTQAIVRDAIPNAEVTWLGVGGEYPAMATAMLADNYYYTARGGNLFADSRITQWTPTALTVTDTISPVTGQQMYKLTCTTTNSGYCGSPVFTLPDACGTEGFTFSCWVEEGTVGLHPYFQIFKNGTPQGAYSANLDSAAYAGGLPVRFVIRFVPGFYSSGDTIQVYLSASNGSSTALNTYQYVSDITITQGLEPGRHAPTTGSPEAVTAAGRIASFGVPLGAYDLGVLCYSNEWGWSNNVATARALSAAVDTLLLYCKRVAIVTPPPMAAADLSGWTNPDSRETPNQGFSNMRNVAKLHNVFFKDMSALFHSIVPSGSVATYMQDQVHPTAAALPYYAQAFAEFCNSSTDYVPRSITTGGMYVQGPSSMTGTWTNELVASASASATFCHIGAALQGDQVWKSSEANATFTQTVSGSQIALMYVLGWAGSVSVKIDTNAPVTYSLPANGYLVCRTKRLADALVGPYEYGPGQHTVVITVVSGTVGLYGLVGF